MYLQTNPLPRNVWARAEPTEQVGTAEQRNIPRTTPLPATSLPIFFREAAGGNWEVGGRRREVVEGGRDWPSLLLHVLISIRTETPQYRQHTKR